MDILPELSSKQLDRLSEFVSNLALVIIASLVLPNIFGPQKTNILELVLGCILTTVLLSLSMVFIRKTDE